MMQYLQILYHYQIERSNPKNLYLTKVVVNHSLYVLTHSTCQKPHAKELPHRVLPELLSRTHRLCLLYPDAMAILTVYNTGVGVYTAMV